MTDFILTISPAQQCMGTDPDTEGPCQLLTTLAEAEHESDCERQLRVHPYCWKHLYMCPVERDSGPTPEEVELERFCIVNFVLGYHDGQGQATILGECDIHEVPPPFEFQANPDNCGYEDIAWYCEWRNGGEVQRGCVVWDTWYLFFAWYPLPAD